MRISTLAWKNIIKNPLNLILNVLLFGLGIGLISFLLLFNEQLKDKFEKNLADVDLVAGAKGSPLQLILCGMYHIDNPTGNISIKNATPLLRPLHPLIKLAVPLSLGDNYKSYRIVGTNHDFLGLYEAELRDGNLYKEDFEKFMEGLTDTVEYIKSNQEVVERRYEDYNSSAPTSPDIDFEI